IGEATVTIEPVASGFTVNKLTVLAVDRAGNQSPLPTQGYSVGFKAKTGAAGLWPTIGSGSTVTDTTSAHHDLSLSGGALLGSGVLTLDGSTGQAATASLAVTTTGSFTVAAWVRPMSLASSSTVLSEDGTSVSNFKLMYDASFGGWCFGQAASDSPSAALVTACASIPPTLGEWVHVVGVYDATAATVSIYVNGGLADYTPVGPAWAASGPFVVGRGLASGSPTQRFTGDVADIRAWPITLDAAGIYALSALPPAAGRWGMDNPASFVASDGSGLAGTHDATLSSGAGWGLGRAGSALTLDGTSGTAVTSGPVIRTDQSFTVSAWVNTTDTSTSTIDTAVTQEGANVGSFFLQKRFGNWAFGRPASDSSSTITWATSTTPASASTWTHLTGVYDAEAGELRLYVNGSLEATATYSNGWNSTGNFVLGRTLWPQQSKEFWPGQLDDARVYRGVLSEWQIGNLVDV
ncbi:MAG: LamG domain-containing protein, partial [Betaproteobacteria bacterium]